MPFRIDSEPRTPGRTPIFATFGLRDMPLQHRIRLLYRLSRECLCIEVERAITAEDVVTTLADLFELRGEPTFIRSDNSAELITKAVKRWLAASGTKTLYIEPGFLWENAYSGTFSSRFSGELLKREVFATRLEAKVLERSIVITTIKRGGTAL
jgi:transposase InsO family protein